MVLQISMGAHRTQTLFRRRVRFYVWKWESEWEREKPVTKKHIFHFWEGAGKPSQRIIKEKKKGTVVGCFGGLKGKNILQKRSVSRWRWIYTHTVLPSRNGMQCAGCIQRHVSYFNPLPLSFVVSPFIVLRFFLCNLLHENAV